jgi:transmembrane sensor
VAEPNLRISVRETAALWYERVNAEHVSDATRNALDAWIAESSSHAAAYEAIERTWSNLKAAAHDSEILSLRHETALRLTRKTSGELRPLRWVAAALILLMLGASLVSFGPYAGLNFSALAWIKDKTHFHGEGRYVTNTGERLSVYLPDGSQITLNTQTELTVAYTQRARSVRLTKGQALFEVAKDASRPFVVQAQDRRFIAVGTAFDVRIEGEEVKVTMLAGTVRAEGSTLGPPVATTTVTAGEQLTIDTHNPDHVRRADPERVTSWRRGQVIFDDTRLGDAVEEINRYSEARIELADPKLGDLRLSGAFATGATATFVEAVTRYFPLKIDHADERTVILQARR